MSFRRHVDHKRKAAEKAWIDRYWPTLKKIGLPPVVYLDYDHWTDFLDNGYIEFHVDPTNFSFTQLSTDQLKQLHIFLEEQYGHDDLPPSLLSWLRVRLQSDQGNNSAHMM